MMPFAIAELELAILKQAELKAYMQSEEVMLRSQLRALASGGNETERKASYERLCMENDQLVHLTEAIRETTPPPAS